MTNDKPTEDDFKNFWSVYEAEQQRRKQQKAKGAHRGKTTS